MSIPVPTSEEARLKSLEDLDLKRSDTSEVDDITYLTAELLGVQTAVVTILEKDTAWLLSQHGGNFPEMPRKQTFCTHTILQAEGHLVIPDTLETEEFKDHPMAQPGTPVRFYAGVALKDGEGLPLGTLCVVDDKPRDFSNEQLTKLLKLGKQVSRHLELHRTNNLLEQKSHQLKESNDTLKDFARNVSHDMKMPLANLIMTADLIRDKYQGKLDKSGLGYIDYMKKSSFQLSDYIDKMLTYYESESIDVTEFEEISLNDYIEDITDLLNVKHDVSVHLPEKNDSIRANKFALGQIFLNLVANAIKYSDKDETIIRVEHVEKDDYHLFHIKDNGMGIPDNKLKSIFNLFETGGTLDREGQKGHGLGLPTVKKLVEKMGGEIYLESELGEGTCISFTIPK